MKLLIVNKYHFISGGAERYFLSLMDSLQKRGIETIPFSVNYPRTLPTPYQKYFLPPLLKDGAAKIANQENFSWSEKWALAKQAVYSRPAFEAVKRICREHRPDAAYFLNFNNHISPSAIDACADAGIPVVMRMSDFNLVCSSNMYYRDGHPCMDCKKGFQHALLHRCVQGSFMKTAVSVFAKSVHRRLGIYQKVRAFIAPTLFMKRELIELGFPESRVHHVNTFVHPRERTEPDPENPYFLFVGRFVPYKGAHLALQAFAKIRRKHPAVSFVLAGDENDAESNRIKELGHHLGPERMVFLPFERDPRKLVRLIQGALFTVVPSQFYENLPHTILESFACGRPVIGTRLGSIPDVIDEGEQGLLFEYGKSADLAHKMDWLLSHPFERERMGNNAWNILQRDYSEEAHLNQLIPLFQPQPDSVSQAVCV